MTPIEIRNIIDQLIQQYGFDKVNKTIQSILDFYAEIEPEDDEVPDNENEIDDAAIAMHESLGENWW